MTTPKAAIIDLCIACGNQSLQAIIQTVKPKVWKKLTTAAEQYADWVAAVSGRIGELTPDGFILESPSIQTFERKPKAAKPSD